MVIIPRGAVRLGGEHNSKRDHHNPVGRRGGKLAVSWERCATQRPDGIRMRRPAGGR